MTSGGGAGGQADVLYIDVTARLDAFEDRMRELEQSAADTGDRAGSKLGAAMSVGLGVAVTGAVALASALTAVGASSFNLAKEAAQNVNEFQSKLGASREEAERLGTVAEQVFGDNWTGSLTEAGEAVATVRKEIKGLADEDLRTVTGGVVAIAETFEQEQGSIAAAVDSLMKATGISVQEATDFITKGFQQGLDSSGDFLDTLNEYAPQFEKSKIGAGELFSLLETGAAKGALGTDKVADAFKEFGLTVIDVSDDSAAVYKELGLSQEKLVKGINDGSLTQAQAFELVTNKLSEVKGQADRTRIGAAIFGGAGEDFANGLTKLDLTKTKLGDLSGATDSLNKRYENFGNFFEAMSRQIQVALLPVGKELLSLANDAMPYLQRAAAWLGERLPGWIKTGLDAVKGFGTGAVNVYNAVRPAIETTAATVGKLTTFLDKNREILIPLAAGLGTVAGAFAIHRAAVIVATTVTTAWTTVTGLATAASVGLRAALTFITGPVGLAVAAITALVAAGVYLYRNWDTVKAKALELWGSLRAIVVGAVDGVVAFLRGIDLQEIGLNIVQGLVNGIKNGAGAVAQAARNLGSSIVGGIKGVLRIQSPSVVMIEAGENIGQGLANGITKTTPAVQAAAARMAYSVTEEVNSARAALEKQISGDAWVDSLKNATTAQLLSAQATARAAGNAEQYGAIKSELERREAAHTAAVQKNADALKGQADELARNRTQIVQGEQQERYVLGLRSATAAQLDSALATARSRGEIDKYNALKGEQARREEATSAATRKAADEAKAAADQVRQAREGILRGEQQERYVEGLRSATKVQLESALATARAGGETEKYNAIRAELERRERAVEDATRRATDAAKAQADQIASNRKAILDGEVFAAYVEGLSGYSDTMLDAARSNALAAGDSQKYNAVLSEQKRRADEAAQAISDLVDQQIRAAGSRYTDTQGATDSAYRMTYGAGDEGLIKSLAAATGLSVARIREDVQGALDDAKKYAPEVAAIIERVWADALTHRRAVGEAERAEIAASTKAEQDAYQAARKFNLDTLGSRTDAGLLRLYDEATAQRDGELMSRVAEEIGRRAEALNTRINDSMGQESANRLAVIKKGFDEEQEAADDAAITVESLTGNIRDLIEQGLDPRKSGFTDWLDELEKKGGKAGTAAAQVKKELADLIAQAQFAQATPAPLDGISEARRTPAPAPTPIAPTPARTAPSLGVSEDRGALSAEQVAFQEQIYRTERIEAYRASLEKLTLEQLRSAQATAFQKGLSDQHAVITAIITDRTKGLAAAQKTVEQTQKQLSAVMSGAVAGPYDGQIAALEQLQTDYPELVAKIEPLIAKMRELNAVAAQQASFDKLKTQIGQVGQAVQGVFKLFGADEQIQQGIGQLTTGIQSGVEAVARFGSGDILGGINAALSAILNIGDAIENLDPGLKAWKKNLLEIARLEKEMMGQRSYGNIKNPYFEILERDAGERERAAGAKWYQRLGWALFGGAPQFLNDETAKFMAQASGVFGDIAEIVVGGLDSALMNAFETGDFAGAEKALDASLNKFVANMALQAVIAASSIGEKIKAYAEARVRALEDGVISADEQKQLDDLLEGIRAEQRAIKDDFAAIAPTLPGYGAGAAQEAPEGSLAKLREQISKLQQDYDQAATDAERKRLQDEIDRLNKQIDDIEKRAGKGGASTGTSTGTSAPPSPIASVKVEVPNSIAATLNLDLLGTLGNNIVSLANVVPQFVVAAQTQVEAASMQLAAANQITRVLEGLQTTPNGRYNA